MTKKISDPAQWRGSYYELEMQYDGRDEEVINAALKTMAKHMNLVYKDNYVEKRQPVQLPIQISKEQIYSFIGKLTYSETITLNSLVEVILDDETASVIVSIPLCEIEEYFSIHYPLTIKQNKWLKRMHEMFIELSVNIYGQSKFQLAMIGDEVSGYTIISEINSSDLCNEEIIFILPVDLQRKLNVEHIGKEYRHQLRMYEDIME
ncbi:hypothetical protein [Bacillus mesophilum]|uniref:Uncharacterized protein n=1 Tax=Bacillus mesophilum TaxID=1071718 RepID=A0A7V7RQ86_9BACI|nr:hypothetical protein [Bacillus mesophilum]KAB2335566.1 hypothetical protein F7732_03050 [Bacillus mesophilum]